MTPNDILVNDSGLWQFMVPPFPLYPQARNPHYELATAILDAYTLSDVITSIHSAAKNSAIISEAEFTKVSGFHLNTINESVIRRFFSAARLLNFRKFKSYHLP